MKYDVMEEYSKSKYGIYVRICAQIERTAWFLKRARLSRRQSAVHSYLGYADALFVCITFLLWR